jgi:hypothetical protein
MGVLAIGDYGLCITLAAGASATSSLHFVPCAAISSASAHPPAEPPPPLLPADSPPARAGRPARRAAAGTRARAARPECSAYRCVGRTPGPLAQCGAPLRSRRAGKCPCCAHLPAHDGERPACADVRPPLSTPRTCSGPAVDGGLGQFGRGRPRERQDRGARVGHGRGAPCYEQGRQDQHHPPRQGRRHKGVDRPPGRMLRRVLGFAPLPT